MGVSPEMEFEQKSALFNLTRERYRQLLRKAEEKLVRYVEYHLEKGNLYFEDFFIDNYDDLHDNNNNNKIEYQFKFARPEITMNSVAEDFLNWKKTR